MANDLFWPSLVLMPDSRGAIAPFSEDFIEQIAEPSSIADPSWMSPIRCEECRETGDNMSSQAQISPGASF